MSVLSAACRICGHVCRFRPDEFEGRLDTSCEACGYNGFDIRRVRGAPP